MIGPVQALVEQVKAFAEQEVDHDPLARQRIAVLVPCYNEEAAIAKVVADFRAALPEADIYVYDNNSRDRTADVARAAGAIVRGETLQGKGRVVRRMFAEVEADIYILVDGDATYDAPSARAMAARLVTDRLDMVVGARIDQEQAAYRMGHRFGNRVLTAFVADVFGKTFTDILSGYRVFSRRFVKSFPVLSGGFEIETELTVHALELELPVAEIETPYYARPEGSHSKLNTWRDGVRILQYHHQAVPFGAPAGVLFRDRNLALDHVGRVRHPDHCHLSSGRRRPAPADRGAVDRIDDHRDACNYLRSRARHGDAGPARDQAAGLPRPAAAGRGFRTPRPGLGSEH